MKCPKCNNANIEPMQLSCVCGYPLNTSLDIDKTPRETVQVNGDIVRFPGEAVSAEKLAYVKSRVMHLAIVVFSNAAEVLLPPTDVSELGSVPELVMGGYTNTPMGLQCAYDLHQEFNAAEKITFLVSDGHANCGLLKPVDEVDKTATAQALEIAKKLDEDGIVATLSVGSDADRESMSLMPSKSTLYSHASFGDLEEAFAKKVQDTTRHISGLRDRLFVLVLDGSGSMNTPEKLKELTMAVETVLAELKKGLRSIGMPKGHDQKLCFSCVAAQRRGMRSEQQDALSVVRHPLSEKTVVAVVDGMGGCPHGRLAAQCAKTAIEFEFMSSHKLHATLPNEKLAEMCMAAADRAVCSLQSKSIAPAAVCVLAVMDNSGTVGVCWKGDAVALYWREAYHVITSPHTASSDEEYQKLCKDAAGPGVTRCLGDIATMLPAETTQVHVDRGEHLILCSDGVYPLLREYPGEPITVRMLEHFNEDALGDNATLARLEWRR